MTCRFLTVTDFEDLRLPFGALATELISHHGTLFNAGPIRPALLASAAIPGIYPPVEINGTLYVDGALSAHVPLQAAFQMGAASLVVLDAGDKCHRQRAPRHLGEMFASTMTAAMRQRVMVEAPAFAQKMPVLYLPSPCPITNGLLNFEHTADLNRTSLPTHGYVPRICGCPQARRHDWFPSFPPRRSPLARWRAARITRLNHQTVV